MKHERLFYGILGTCVVFSLVLNSYNYLEYKESKEQKDEVKFSCGLSVSIGQARNLSDMDCVYVEGGINNIGSKMAKNATISVIFLDTAHDKVTKKMVNEKIEIPPDRQTTMKFDAEYLRESTIPKTFVDVVIQVDWEENGKLKTWQNRKM